MISKNKASRILINYLALIKIINYLLHKFSKICLKICLLKNGES